jgi:hypothetical protein
MVDLWHVSCSLYQSNRNKIILATDCRNPSSLLRKPYVTLCYHFRRVAYTHSDCLYCILYLPTNFFAVLLYFIFSPRFWLKNKAPIIRRRSASDTLIGHPNHPLCACLLHCSHPLSVCLRHSNHPFSTCLPFLSLCIWISAWSLLYSI